MGTVSIHLEEEVCYAAKCTWHACQVSWQAGALYDLASLRAGGATFLLQRFEDSELVRRRGRWISARVCEIYIQETCVATHAEAMPTIAFQRVQKLASAFPAIRDKAIFLLNAHIPTSAWPRMFYTSMRRLRCGSVQSLATHAWLENLPALE